MNEAKESGICDGLAFSMPGKFGEITAFGLARTHDDPSTAKDYNAMASLYLLSVYFHETYRKMCGEENLVKLTKREAEILQWASEGKTDDLISDVLNISMNTVRFHWKIFSKA